MTKDKDDVKDRPTINNVQFIGYLMTFLTYVEGAAEAHDNKSLIGRVHGFRRTVRQFVESLGHSTDP